MVRNNKEVRSMGSTRVIRWALLVAVVPRELRPAATSMLATNERRLSRARPIYGSRAVTYAGSQVVTLITILARSFRRLAMWATCLPG